ncbi:glycosyltransferase family 4 protein [Meridianimaribacter sp. CL38]|uniref:glycosyltransferase family 4 protein n=1 Tax=Meridianimaribacter sp. CL38 TaxID=2213021 RepID=UPI001EDFCF18|nr:glycosyltransferase family 4 protein [Meridianimaribacter sp. CL38]
MSRKRIALLCNYELLPNRVGGMDHFFWSFNAKCLAEGITVDWFFPNTATHGAYDTFNIYASGSPNVESCFIEVASQPEQHYDVIVTHFLELNTAFYKRVKAICNSVLIGVEHNPRPMGGYSFKKRLKKRLKGLLYSRYIDVFIGVSNSTVAELVEDYGGIIASKTKTIYNGVLIDEIVPNTQPRRLHNPSYLVVSHLRPSKGIQDLIHAVHKIPEEIQQHIRIDVYGDGPYRATLQDMVTAYKLGAVFTFKGSSSELHRLYSKYDYMLQPTHMECFSLSILESLAANVPVVTTNVGGNEEVISSHGNGYIYPAKDIYRLKALLIHLYEGTYSISADTRPLIRNSFSIERMVAHHFDLIQTCVTKS